MTSKEFSKKCLTLISNDSISFLLSETIRSKLNNLEKQSLLSEKQSLLSGLQNTLALTLGKFKKYDSDLNLGIISREQSEVIHSKIQSNCIHLVNEISKESDFFLDNVIAKTFEHEPQFHKPINKNVKRELNNLEIKYQRTKSIENYSVLFIDIEPENNQVELISLFEYLKSINRISTSKTNDNFFEFSNTRIKCTNEIRKENLINDSFGFIPLVISMDANFLPNISKILYLKSLLQMYGNGISPIFCFLYSQDALESEKIKKFLSQNGIVVETLGGFFQCQEVCLSKGSGIQLLIEKIFFELEILELDKK